MLTPTQERWAEALQVEKMVMEYLTVEQADRDGAAEYGAWAKWDAPVISDLRSGRSDSTLIVQDYARKRILAEQGQR